MLDGFIFGIIQFGLGYFFIYNYYTDIFFTSPCFGGFFCAIFLFELIAARDIDKDWKATFQKLLKLIAGFLPAIIIFLTISPTARSNELFKYQDAYYEKINIAHFLIPFFNNSTLEYALSLLLLIALVTLFFSKRIYIVFPMRGILICLGIIYLILPTVIFTSHNADWRLLVPLSFLLILASRLNKRRVYQSYKLFSLAPSSHV